LKNVWATKKINPDDYVACDCAKELLSKHPWRIKKVVCNLEKDWPFEDESFDLLSAFFLLEHIEDIEHFFSEAYRILKNNGQLIIGHFLQRRLFMWSINWRRFKIEQFPHTIEDLENQAKEIWFKTWVMPLRDVCDNKLITWHLLVCEKI
jgi:ubiquinone/menaquinone biosynthesis C-methylase UbiE